MSYYDEARTSQIKNDNVIDVTIKPDNKDVGNIFVDVEDNRSSSGSVTGDDSKQLFGIVLQLLNPDGSIIATTTTDIKKGSMSSVMWKLPTMQ
jgi:hypothetical protein